MELDETKRSSLCDTISDFSINNVKLKLKVKDLKENLFPNRKLKSKVSSIEKIDKLIDEEKRMIKVKIHKDEKSLDRLLGKAFSLRQSHLKLRKICQKEREKRKNNDNNLTDMNILKGNYEFEDRVLRRKMKNADYCRSKSEEKTKSIAVYCNDTKEKTENIEGTVIYILIIGQSIP
jgi:hypothetical protein